MTKIKIVYNREKCIGAIVCANVNPELWEMDTSDAKANLKGSKKEGKNYILETEMSLYLQMAAEQCPADVIEIFDAKTGKKLF